MPKAVRWMSDREWNVRWNKDSQKRMSEDVTDRMSDMPDGMTDRMSDMPDRMSEDAPDRLTEDARRMSVECQIECQKI